MARGKVVVRRGRGAVPSRPFGRLVRLADALLVGYEKAGWQSNPERDNVEVPVLLTHGQIRLIEECMKQLEAGGVIRYE